MNSRFYQLEGVVKGYGDIVVLENVDAQIPLGGITAIVGPSGSGKSTIIRMLSFLEGPERGHLLLREGEKQSRYGDAPWPRITCVFQKQFLWPHMTLRENIILPMKEAGTKDRDEHLALLVADFQMQDFIDRYPNQVSGGQAQRAAIVRALAVGPSVLLLDEVHNGLDIENQTIVNTKLRSLAVAGVSVIVVSHSLDFVDRYADRIVVVKDGAITVCPDQVRTEQIPYFASSRGTK